MSAFESDVTKRNAQVNLPLARVLFACLAMLLVLFALLTLAGVPNGLARGSLMWWTIVGLFFLDAILMGIVSWGLGTIWRDVFFVLGLILITGNLILMALDQVGWVDLAVMALLLMTGVFLLRARKEVSRERAT